MPCRVYAKSAGIRNAFLWQRFAGLGEIDMAGKIGKAHCLTDLAIFVKQRFAQFTEAETAAEAFHLFAL